MLKGRGQTNRQTNKQTNKQENLYKVEGENEHFIDNFTNLRNQMDLFFLFLSFFTQSPIFVEQNQHLYHLYRIN